MHSSIKRLTFLTLFFVSFVANSTLYTHTTSSWEDPSSIVGANFIIRTEVNLLVFQWRPDDVVMINGNPWKYNAGGNFTPANSSDIANARRNGGTVDTSEGGCNTNPNFAISLYSRSSAGNSCNEGDGSPLVIDLEGNGFEFTGHEHTVYFDLDGNYDYGKYQWLKPDSDDAFLALDLNNNKTIDDGKELFGTGTEMILEDNKKALNGFQALAQYDNSRLGGNEDGIIDSKDKVWSSLMIWNDLNSDGFSQKSEVKKLKKSGIKSISLDVYSSDNVDNHNNRLPYWSTVNLGNKQVDIVDVFFLRYYNTSTKTQRKKNQSATVSSIKETLNSEMPKR